jgi:hypothetical protein
MTWASTSTHILSVLVVLPLVLAKFTTADIALWFLFGTIVNLQLVGDMGFSATFSRVIAYAMGGAGIDRLKNQQQVVSGVNARQPNWDAVQSIVVTMRYVYFRLSLIVFVVLAVAVTAALVKPVSAVDDAVSAWLAWGLVLAGVIVGLWGGVYSSYLQGSEEIAKLRRWEALSTLGSTATSVLVLVSGGELLSLIAVTQGWAVFNVLRNRWLCRVVKDRRFARFAGAGVDKAVLDAVWPSAWRSGVGVFTTYGLVQASGLIYAQVGSTSNVASYLFALRMMQVVNRFALAPFYTKLPTLARLRSQGDISQQIEVAKQGMSWVYWVYVFGFVGVGIFADPLMRMIGAKVEFVGPLIWAVLGLAMFVERYGAMHLHLYSTTNHIIWHVVSAGFGVIYIVVSLSLLPVLGMLAFPLGWLAGQLGFYAWYSALHSYRTFNLKFWAFEKTTALPPLFVALLYSIWSIF